jgi:hypothetical protein
MTFPPIPWHEGVRVTLANGLPAYTRNRRVTQSDINRHGSRAKALEARGYSA